MKRFPPTAVLLVVALTACSFAPDYRGPDNEQVPVQYKEAGDWKPAQPADTQPRGAWWSEFHDYQLDTLEAKVGDANQNIKAALARLEQARAQMRAARADLVPTVTAGSTAARGRTSISSPRFPLWRFSFGVCMRACCW